MKKNSFRIFTALLFFALYSNYAQNTAFNAELNAVSAVVIDAETGSVIFEKDPDLRIPPASLTKLMTMHIALSAVEKGKASLDDVVELPSAAWARNQPPRSSLMFLAQGHIVTLRELLLGLSIPSGNDAAQAVALYFAPSIESFAAIMNEEARRMGLKATHFVEPSGIDENNMTTAYEFAKFCREYLRQHPEATHDFHSVSEFEYPKDTNLPAYMRNGSNKPVTQYNHVPLLGNFEGADGLKTGYIDEAGYNAAVTAERNGTRFIAVALGVPAELGAPWGDRARAADCRALLSWAFSNYKTARPPAPEIPEARIWKAKSKTIKLIVAEKTAAGTAAAGTAAAGTAAALLSAFTIPIDRGSDMRWETELFLPLAAPLPAGTEAGVLKLYDEDGILKEIPLVTAEPAEKGGFFRRLFDSIMLLFQKKSTTSP